MLSYSNVLLNQTLFGIYSNIVYLFYSNILYLFYSNYRSVSYHKNNRIFFLHCANVVYTSQTYRTLENRLKKMATSLKSLFIAVLFLRPVWHVSLIIGDAFQRWLTNVRNTDTLRLQRGLFGNSVCLFVAVRTQDSVS